MGNRVCPISLSAGNQDAEGGRLLTLFAWHAGLRLEEGTRVRGCDLQLDTDPARLEIPVNKGKDAAAWVVVEKALWAEAT